MDSTSSDPSDAAAPAAPIAGALPEAAERAVDGIVTTASVPEFGGRKDGSEPTRFGDWEKNGRCIDF